MKARIRRVQISAEAFPMIFRQGSAWRVYEGIPDGAIFKGWCIDPHNNVLSLFIEHPSFESVDVYATLPLLELEFLAIK
jgi:hypothetical protein